MRLKNVSETRNRFILREAGSVYCPVPNFSQTDLEAKTLVYIQSYFPIRIAVYKTDVPESLQNFFQVRDFAWTCLAAIKTELNLSESLTRIFIENFSSCNGSVTAFPKGKANLFQKGTGILWSRRTLSYSQSSSFFLFPRGGVQRNFPLLLAARISWAHEKQEIKSEGDLREDKARFSSQPHWNGIAVCIPAFNTSCFNCICDFAGCGKHLFWCHQLRDSSWGGKASKAPNPSCHALWFWCLGKLMCVLGAGGGS